MSILSQLAAKIAASAAAAAAPLTQPPTDPNDASSDSHCELSIPAAALIPAPRPSSSSSPPTDAASVHDRSDDDAHEASVCSPCLSSTPPPFVAPDMHMLDTPPPAPSASVTVMPWREQQQCREQLIRAPGLYASWCMRRMVSMHSVDSARIRNDFSKLLVAGRVTRFELVFAYNAGLRREVTCCYTILESEVVFREMPLRAPHVRFCQDGKEVQLVEGAAAWSVMHCHFHLQFMPFLLLGTAKPVRQAH